MSNEGIKNFRKHNTIQYYVKSLKVPKWLAILFYDKGIDPQVVFAYEGFETLENLVKSLIKHKYAYGIESCKARVDLFAKTKSVRSERYCSFCDKEYNSFTVEDLNRHLLAHLENKKQGNYSLEVAETLRMVKEKKSIIGLIGKALDFKLQDKRKYVKGNLDLFPSIKDLGASELRYFKTNVMDKLLTSKINKLNLEIRLHLGIDICSKKTRPKTRFEKLVSSNRYKLEITFNKT